MVKEGPFLNGDQDFPTKRSKLVDQKKSRNIADDVSPTLESDSLPAQIPIEIQQPKIYKYERKTVTPFLDRNMPVNEIDSKMPAPQVVSSPKIVPQLQPKAENLKVGQQSRQLEGSNISPWGFSMANSPLVFQPTKPKDPEKANDVLFKVASEKMMPPHVMQVKPVLPLPREASQDRTASAINGNLVDDTIPKSVVSNDTKEMELSDSVQDKGDDNVVENIEYEIAQENFEDEIVQENFEDEVAQAKLKLIIR